PDGPKTCISLPNRHGTQSRTHQKNLCVEKRNCRKLRSYALPKVRPRQQKPVQQGPIVREDEYGAGATTTTWPKLPERTARPHWSEQLFPIRIPTRSRYEVVGYVPGAK